MRHRHAHCRGRALTSHGLAGHGGDLRHVQQDGPPPPLPAGAVEPALVWSAARTIEHWRWTTAANDQVRGEPELLHERLDLKQPLLKDVIRKVVILGSGGLSIGQVIG